MKTLIKTQLLLGVLIAFPFISSYAQGIVNNGASIKIESGLQLVVSGGGLTNTNSASLVNEGSIILASDLSNINSSSISGNGSWDVSGNWNNQSIFYPGTSTVNLRGSDATNISSSGSSFYDLNIDKGLSPGLSLLDNAMVLNELNFENSGNRFFLGEYNLSIDDTITGYGADNYLVSNGNGFLIKNGLGEIPFCFPVGYDASTYNPIRLADSGTIDSIGVRCLEHCLSSGFTGLPAPNGVVDASWQIQENTSGGSDLSISCQWAQTDEMSGFDHDSCYASAYAYGLWDYPGCFNTASGSGPYELSRCGIDFMQDSLVLAVSSVGNVNIMARVFLEGAYDAVGDSMKNTLYPSLPLLQPFQPSLPYFENNSPEWYYEGAEDLSVSGFPDENIVDWLLLELRHASSASQAGSSTIIGQQAALLDVNGQVINTSGGFCSFLVPRITDSLYLVVYHRNHLGVLSAFGLTDSNNDGLLDYDFSDSENKVYGGALGYKIIDGSSGSPDERWGLVGGDGDADGNIYPSDKLNVFDVQSSQTGYKASDYNMDGNVYPTDLQNIYDPNSSTGSQLPENRMQLSNEETQKSKYSSAIPE